MKLIFKYMKAFVLSFLLVVAMTFIQVQMELILPDYMSSIVTDGIQYGGITDTVPLALSKDTYQAVVSPDLSSAYQLVEAGSESWIDGKPVAFKEDTYILKEGGKELVGDKLVSALAAYGGVSEETEAEGMAKTVIQQEYKKIGMNVESLQSGFIISAGLKMLGFSLIGIVAQLIASFFSTRTATTIATRIRHDVFEKVSSFSNAEFSRFSTSSLITRTTNDITQVQMVSQMLMRIVLMAPMMGLTSLYKVMRYPSMAWILLVAIGVIVALMVVILVTTMPKFKVVQTLVDRMNNVMREFLEGMLVVRAFNAQEHEEERFDKANKENARINLFLNRVMAIIMPLANFIMNILTVAIIWFAAAQIDINAMEVGEMMAFIQYAMHVVMSFMMVAMIWVMIPRALVSADRISEVLNTESTINDLAEPAAMPSENQPLVFDDVCFAYPGAEEEVLKNISFRAEPGETLAIIGSTGSGKSTIIQLIPRLFDPTKGAIRFGERDIREFAQADVRSRIGYAPQKANLFTGTIGSNICFGRDLSAEYIDEAVKVSQTTGIVAEREKGLEEAIAQGGNNVSGGQKQRISIARALAARPLIYLFDDSFSALDYATDKKLRGELSEVVARDNATVIIVAQRVSTIRNADKIVVLDEGEVKGIGTHDELFKNCEVYRDIALSQLSEEELING